MTREKLIAVAGKGGTGKTTFSALLLRYLSTHYDDKSILAVDADANANLNEALGLEVEETISTTLGDMKDPRLVPSGMSKDMFMQMRLSQALVESEQIDLLVMGNPSGPGCYCYPNDLLRNYLEKLRVNYDYVVVDNEAGLEHLSRRIINNVDYLLITSDATARGIRSAGRVYDIIKSVNINAEKIYLIVSRTQDGELSDLQEEIARTGLEVVGTVPLDSMVMEFDLKGKPLFQLPGDSPALKAVENIALKLKL
ncbi:MAG: carbon monoxide dehydrogenase [Dethiobacter sp.]|jgi:CO dehydrogenase maturation factor|nr:MAG: carbon monoxide dehydrogenase [Dethiobacter sp.]